jgi:hypothetical protein
MEISDAELSDMENEIVRLVRMEFRRIRTKTKHHQKPDEQKTVEQHERAEP